MVSGIKPMHLEATIVDAIQMVEDVIINHLM